MRKHHQQRFFLSPAEGFALLKLFIATALYAGSKEPIKLRLQTLSDFCTRTVPIGQQIAVKRPEAVLEVIQQLSVIGNARSQRAFRGDLRESSTAPIQP